MIDFGNPRSFEGQMFQAFDGGFAGELPERTVSISCRSCCSFIVARPRRWLDIIYSDTFVGARYGARAPINFRSG